MPRTERIVRTVEMSRERTEPIEQNNGVKSPKSVTFMNVRNKRETRPKKVFPRPKKLARSKSRMNKMAGSRKMKVRVPCLLRHR